MKFPVIQLKHVLIAALMIVSAPWAQAECRRVTSIGTGINDIPQEVADMGYTATPLVTNGNNAPISFGVLSIGTGSVSLNPPGTLLGTANVDVISSGLHAPYAANQILYKCPLSDADSLYEMYATANSNFYGGIEVNDIDSGYITPAKNVAFRITNQKAGAYYTKFWQERKLTAADYITVGSTIYVPASAFSNITFELLKTNDSGNISYADPRNAFNTLTQAQATVRFKPVFGMTSPIAGAQATSPSASATNIVAVWGMRGGSTTIIHGETCVVSDFDQVVTLPPIGAAELNASMTSTSNFNVAIECDAGAVSGTVTNTTTPPVAMGFLVTQPTALAQAATLGLKNASGGISHLLDNSYGTSGVASGVGIRIYPEGSSTPLTLLSTNTTTGTGNAAGWYGFSDYLDNVGATGTGGSRYSGLFTASLERLPRLQATAGSVHAQAQIFVSLQ
ncbi:TPA: fimbrial protein [Raoultella planticola]|uniref:fimbrial protein n=1 Tax=Raoultella planticola TaxID=575 RepID=UPI0024910260